MTFLWIPCTTFFNFQLHRIFARKYIRWLFKLIDENNLGIVVGISWFDYATFIGLIWLDYTFVVGLIRKSERFIIGRILIRRLWLWRSVKTLKVWYSSICFVIRLISLNFRSSLFSWSAQHIIQFQRKTRHIYHTQWIRWPVTIIWSTRIPW